MSFKQAGEKAVELAIEENLLNGFFSKEKAEVLGTYLHEFHQDWYERDLREEGRAEGARDARLEAARNLLAMHVLSPEQIAQAQGLTVDEVLAIAAELKS